MRHERARYDLSHRLMKNKLVAVFAKILPPTAILQMPTQDRGSLLSGNLTITHKMQFLWQGMSGNRGNIALEDAEWNT
jgi:hypothetical protein